MYTLFYSLLLLPPSRAAGVIVPPGPQRKGIPAQQCWGEGAPLHAAVVAMKHVAEALA